MPSHCQLVQPFHPEPDATQSEAPRATAQRRTPERRSETCVHGHDGSAASPAVPRAAHRDLGIEEGLQRQRHAADHLGHKQRVGAVVQDCEAGACRRCEAAARPSSEHLRWLQVHILQDTASQLRRHTASTLAQLSVAPCSSASGRARRMGYALAAKSLGVWRKVGSRSFLSVEWRELEA
jgi:hypothetical protein